MWGADAVEREQARGAGGHQRHDQLIKALQLGNWTRRPSSRSAIRVA